MWSNEVDIHVDLLYHMGGIVRGSVCALLVLHSVDRFISGRGRKSFLAKQEEERTVSRLSLSPHVLRSFTSSRIQELLTFPQIQRSYVTLATRLINKNTRVS